MAYLAWLCKEHPYDDEDEESWKVEFREPNRYAYAEVMPVSLTPLKDFNEQH